jgi:hypothetical protein
VVVFVLSISIAEWADWVEWAENDVIKVLIINFLFRSVPQHFIWAVFWDLDLNQDLHS